MSADYATARSEFASAEKERDELLASFESRLQDIQQQSDFPNVVLEGKLEELKIAVADVVTQTEQVVSAAGLDPHAVAAVSEAIAEEMSAEAKHVEDLQYRVVRVSKQYNDMLRTYTARMVQMGIPEDELATLGFDPLPGNFTTAPAGLITTHHGAARQ